MAGNPLLRLDEYRGSSAVELEDAPLLTAGAGEGKRLFTGPAVLVGTGKSEP
jgi:hypothetical protein